MVVNKFLVSQDTSQNNLAPLIRDIKELQTVQANLETGQANLETGQANLETGQANLETVQANLTEYPKTIVDESQAIDANSKTIARGFQAVDLQIFRADNARIAAGTQSALIGGRNNGVNSITSGVFVGENNVIRPSVARAVIMGGNNNECNVNTGGIVGGFENKLLVGASDSFIAGGGGGSITHGVKCGIIGGNNPLIQGTALASANEAVIAGGSGNKILDFTNRSCIVGGLNNQIQQSEDATIVGGTVNKVKTGSRYAFIAGGFENSIQNSTMGSIIGSTLSVIEGGLNTAHSNEASILAGSQNNIQGASPRATIVGGIENFMSQAPDAAIIASENSSCRSQNGFVAGGLACLLSTNSARSAILGGQLNQIYTSPNSATLGGNNNIIDGRGGAITSSILIGRNNNCTHSNCIILSGNTSTTNSSYDDELTMDAASYRISNQKRTITFEKLFAPGFNFSSHLNATVIPIQRTAGVYIRMWYTPARNGLDTSFGPGYIEDRYIAWRRPDTSFLESDDVQERPPDPNGVKISVSILSEKLWLTTTTPSSTNDWLCRFEIDYLYDIIDDYLKPY
jgi:exonuclease VII small subunit